MIMIAKSTTKELWRDFLVCERAANTARSVYDYLEASEKPDHDAIFKAQSLLADAYNAEYAAYQACKISMLADEELVG